MDTTALVVNATPAARVDEIPLPLHSSAFSGDRWPPGVIRMAVRWYGSRPLSAAQVVRRLAERNSNVTTRRVLNWVQAFGPQ